MFTAFRQNSLFRIGIPFFLTLVVGVGTLQQFREGKYKSKSAGLKRERKHAAIPNHPLLNRAFEPETLDQALTSAFKSAKPKRDYEMLPNGSENVRWREGTAEPGGESEEQKQE
jgi:hypothetical protein